MATIVVAPDSFGGTLSASEATTAIATGWCRVQPDDDVVACPMSDGGQGLLEVVATPADERVDVEVVGPLGLPVRASYLRRPDGTALIESAQACGLHLVDPVRRDPLHTTTWGVGQLLDHAIDAGARRVVLGLGGSATVDGGAGALSGMGYRLVVADGSGLKIGGEDLHRIAAVSRGWAQTRPGVTIDLLADVTATYREAARLFGPQKGATEATVSRLEQALDQLLGVLVRDLGTPEQAALADLPGSGAAGGIGVALAVAMGARFRPGAAEVAAVVDLDGALSRASLVITGEGRLDGTTARGKVVGEVVERAARHGIPAAAVVGQLAEDADTGGLEIEQAAPRGPGEDPAAEVADAAERLARRLGRR